jgi:SAM-dependent methyltransferase
VPVRSFFKRLRAECAFVAARQWTYEDVGRHWDAVTDYDDINRRAYSYFRRFVDAHDLCRFPAHSYVLDVCSRTGKGTSYFFEQGKIGKAVCADVSESMLSACLSTLAGKSIPSRGVCFKSLPLPFEDGEFDAVLCFETIEHMPHPRRFMEELGRVVRRGGELVLTTPNALWGPGHWFAAVFNLHHSEGPHRFLSRGYILEAARAAGFALTRERTGVIIPAGPRCVVRIGEALERVMPECIRRRIALRRVFIFERA